MNTIKTQGNEAQNNSPGDSGEERQDVEFGPRDFDCCAYQSKSGNTTCGALRYYHDEPRTKTFRGHKFVEPARTLTETEILLAENNDLKAEIAHLKEYIRDLNSDLESSNKFCEENHVDGRGL